MLEAEKKLEELYSQFRTYMKAIEFIIEAEQQGFFAVGDSIAYNLAMGGGPWKSFGKMGATSADAAHKAAIDQIPKGSIVAISLGFDELTNTTESPQQISARINSLVQYASSKGLQPVFVLFPRMSGQFQQTADALRAAIFTAVRAPMLDMQSGAQVADYKTIANQILSKFGGAVASVSSTAQPEGPVAPAKGLNFKPGVDPRINPALAAKIQKIFAEYGRSLPIQSGYRDPARNKKAGGAKNSAHMRHNAVDVDTGALSHEERLKLIRIASANGIGGIGVYTNNLHFDIENRRAWGPNYSHTSIPGWARKTISAHLSGPLSSGSQLV